MDRIIPFGYPTIPGGASGGASVDPTPPSSDDPDTPTTLPYNLDAAKVVDTKVKELCTYVGNVWVAAETASAAVYVASGLTFEGIEPLDLTSVRQISLTGPTTWLDDSVVFTADGVDIRSMISQPQYGINLPVTLTIDKFLSGKVGLGHGNPNISKDNYNNNIRGKQIVLSFPVHVDILDAQGEILQSVDMAVSL